MRRVVLTMALGLLALAVPALAGPDGVQRPLGGYPAADLGPRSERAPHALTGGERAESRSGWTVRTEHLGGNGRIAHEVFVPRFD